MNRGRSMQCRESCWWEFIVCHCFAEAVLTTRVIHCFCEAVAHGEK